MLDRVPCPRVASVRSRSDSRIELLKPRYRETLLQRILTPYLRAEQCWDRFPLDARASRIWRLIDGRRTVGEVVDAYRGIHPEDHDQIDLRICRFLQLLRDQGFLDLVER